MIQNTTSTQANMGTPRTRTAHPEISGLIYGAPDTSPHEDQRRVLGTIFNGSFSAQQGKYLQFKMACVAGGHSHTYNELTFVLSGDHTFQFEDLRPTAITRDRIEITLFPGEILVVPAGVAHRGFHPANSMIVAFTEQPYTSAAENDIPHNFK